MPDPRLLVCGGRDYADRARVATVLERFRAKFGIAVLIQGDAAGADRLAGEWAGGAGVPVIAEPARWSEHGRAAGPIRNQAMIDQHKPTHCIAFPGGSGTADMARRARAAGLVVYMLAR